MPITKSGKYIYWTTETAPSGRRYRVRCFKKGSKVITQVLAHNSKWLICKEGSEFTELETLYRAGRELYRDSYGRRR